MRKPSESTLTYATVAGLASLAFICVFVKYRSDFPQPERQLYDAYMRIDSAHERLSALESRLDNADDTNGEAIREQIVSHKREFAMAAKEKARIKSMTTAYPAGMLAIGLLWITVLVLLVGSVLSDRKLAANQAIHPSPRKSLG